MRRLLCLTVLAAAFLVGCNGAKEVSAEDASTFGKLPAAPAK